MDTETSPSPPTEPSLPWRIGSAILMGFVGINAQLFMFGANTTEVHGLDGFLRILDQRKDPGRRERGLITGNAGYIPKPLGRGIY